MSSYDMGALGFGLASTLLYVGWAFFSYHTPERHMTFALGFYACANLALLWPVLYRLFFS